MLRHLIDCFRLVKVYPQREDWQLWVLGSTSVLGCGWEMARPDPSSDLRETSRPLLLPSSRPTHLVMGRKLCSKQGGTNILTNKKNPSWSGLVHISPIRGVSGPHPLSPVIVSILLTSTLPPCLLLSVSGCPPPFISNCQHLQTPNLSFCS